MGWGPIDKLAGNAVKSIALKVGMKKADETLTARFPHGWPALCEAAKGWKLITAGMMVAYPAALLWFVAQWNGQGGHISAVQANTWCAFGLGVIALIDKGLKFFLAYKFGVDADTPPPVEVTGPLGTTFNFPADWSKRRRDAYASAYEGAVKAGVAKDTAGEVASAFAARVDAL